MAKVSNTTGHKEKEKQSDNTKEGKNEIREEEQEKIEESKKIKK